jgi:hypothetical protein
VLGGGVLGGGAAVAAKTIALLFDACVLLTTAAPLLSVPVSGSVATNGVAAPEKTDRLTPTTAMLVMIRRGTSYLRSGWKVDMADCIV